MIAYHILCHGNFEQVALLVEALYCEEDTFLIDIDDGNKPNTKPVDHLARRPNVHVVRDANIGWGGGGTLRKTIKGAFRLLKLNAHWKYYIVLSGQDMPLKSNESIKRFYSAGFEKGTNYIRNFKVDRIEVEDLAVSNKTAVCQLWGDRGHTRVYGKPGTINPQDNHYARILVDVTEVGEKGEVYVGLCDSLLQKRRELFFSQYPFHFGANWFSLHRSLLDAMQHDAFAYELYDVMRTTFIPDESYFQTYINNTRFKNTSSQDYGRLILRPGPVPRVKVLDMDDWESIESSDALYARKFDIKHDKKLVKRVLAERR
ncbi:MAG: beta-1,6-N-acetylglucosaminyltransferase [Granulosicoccus sp.]